MMGIKKAKHAETQVMSDLFLGHYPERSHFAESFKSLRANINFSFLEKELRSLVITSADAGEGKSTCVANLAFTIAIGGKSVLMIDADLRKPVLNRIIPDMGSPGLGGILADIFSTEVTSGAIAKFNFSDLVQLLSFQKKTGILHLAEENEKVDIAFKSGKLVDVSWLTRPQEKKLATLLINENVITSSQAKDALGRQRHTGQKLGLTLINMGIVKNDLLAGYIDIHMLEGLRNAIQFKTGTFAFEKRSDGGVDDNAFNPADLPALYDQAVFGQEAYNYLRKSIEACIVSSETEGLFFLPSGPRALNPAELLTSERMTFLLNYLTQRFDVLVIDSPPILLTGDALLLAPQADGVVLVVRAGQANRELIKKSVEQVERAKAHLIGVALNDVDLKRAGYYKGYYKNSSYYYGDDE